MIIRIATLVAFLVGASAVSLAPAQADTLNGLYSATGTSQGKENTKTWLITPCGSNCIRVQWDPPGPHVDTLHMQGGVWTGTGRDGCTTTIDGGSMTGTFGCGQNSPAPLKLTKVS